MLFETIEIISRTNSGRIFDSIVQTVEFYIIENDTSF